MSKQTLQQKIQRVLARFTPRRIAIIMLGTAILSFGIHNIHQRTAITEGVASKRTISTDFSLADLKR